eukprot:8350175-Pyramimonas_sp.AAC.1
MVKATMYTWGTDWQASLWSQEGHRRLQYPDRGTQQADTDPRQSMPRPASYQTDAPEPGVR